MKRRRFWILPIGIVAVAIAYYFLSGHEPSGSVLLLIWGGAMAVMGWVLLPTVDNVGPTAPVDPEYEPKRD
ncbi:MAG: hypothetical protein E6J47_01525 [Chloroflexi bacterium]|nr:MAG: hypothetical protein E6J47_01525 [Chloroflexota bacterium]